MKNLIKASLLAAMVAAPAMADEAFGGIGVTIYQLRDGVKVAEVIPGTPAADTKIQAGDVIISVDGVSLKGQNIEFSKEQLRGQVNKPLEITFVSGADTLSTVIRRAQITVKDLESEGVEAWYGDKTEFNAQELETYASSKSEKQLVAVLKHGYRVPEGTVNAAGLNGIYVEKADEFAPKASPTAAKPSSASLKGFNRKAVSFELKSAGTAIVTIMNADGEQVATLRADNAQAGYNTLRWNAENVPSGRYMVTIEHNGSISGKNAVLK
ncbi:MULTISPECIES: PDZ domain-containing protein [unclassified Fibrobacter]|uniref:PDZ domain-containing protein n=1 Tax=unclassified Fibrobacter TaxID=2634177 RepID=UPI000D6DA8AB|nr:MULTISPECIES: PDZ domain-containing protein [unclassified Fibrobacter]PWJ71677.1 FlgD-like protein [Fibrobacter sp. UWR4]PZW74098.1 FlgD-like protein [Fibrobacter sp. UWR1]